MVGKRGSDAVGLNVGSDVPLQLPIDVVSDARAGPMRSQQSGPLCAGRILTFMYVTISDSGPSG